MFIFSNSKQAIHFLCVFLDLWQRNEAVIDNESLSKHRLKYKSFDICNHCFENIDKYCNLVRHFYTRQIS